MLNIIIGAVISIVSTALGAIVQMFINERLDKKKNEMDLLKFTYEKRIFAYEKIYSKLSECKRIYGNILRFQSEAKKEWFNPTISLIEETYSIFLENEIYINKSTWDELDLKLQVTRIKNERINNDTSLSYIFELSDENYKWIRETLDNFRKDMGIDKLDKLPQDK